MNNASLSPTPSTTSPERIPANGRVFTRVEYEVSVNLKSANNFYTGLAENVSEGGLFIATEAPLHMGEELTVHLRLMRAQPESYHCEVCWIRPTGANGRLPAGMGVRFKDLTTAQTSALQSFVDTKVKDTVFFETD